MKKSIYSIGKAMDKANSVVEVFTGYMIFAFMALLFLQVLMRFIFKHPIYGIDECVTALMIWSMCLGWCTVYWDNGHAVLEFIMNRMPKAFRRGMFTFTNFLIDKLGLYSGILAAVSDAEEDASRWRTSYQQGLLLCIAGSGDGSDYAGNVCI
jgi:TRAP-type C4-dicarboxylate transport system permease small subunit